MKLTDKSIIILMAIMITTTAMAQEETIEKNNVRNTVALNTVFDMAELENIQVSELSNQEMKATQGAVAPWIIGGAVGGVSGGAMYSYGVWRGNYQWNTTRFLGNVGTGALIGGTFGAAAGGGLSLGANVWRVNSVSANFGVNTIWRH